MTPLIKPDDGKVIFVESNGDLFADCIPKEWIIVVLLHCRKYEQNTYLYQSKNPIRFYEFVEAFPKKTVLGSTIETNRDYGVSLAPCPERRYFDVRSVASIADFRWMVSIEPIMDFDLDIMLSWIREIRPDFVSIGADSGKNHLPEPPPSKVVSLVKELEKLTQVRIKKNLKRIVGLPLGSRGQVDQPTGIGAFMTDPLRPKTSDATV